MPNRKFTITPIGSCRVASPARAGIETHGVTVIRPRSYGFTHSSAEAVQQARFMTGGGAIPPELWPLIGRDNDYDKIHNTAFRPADLYLVEISSAKILSVDDWLVQLNYFQNHFRDFLSDKARAAEYWALVEAGDAAPLERFLDERWSQTEDQRREARLLGRLRMARTTDDSLRADLNSLRDLLGDRIVVVTHMNVRDEKGQFLAGRAALIEQVHRIATEEGLAVFDPSPLIERVGQDEAVDNGSGRYAHYNHTFFPLLFEAWYRTHIEPMIDGNAVRDGAVEALLANLKARLGAGAADEVRDRIAALPEPLRSDPAVAGLLAPAEAQADEVQADEARADEVQATEPQSAEARATEPQSAEAQATGAQATEVQSAETQATEPQSAEPQATGAQIA